MPIPQSILERIETFRRDSDSHLNPGYHEARGRQEFITPLFSALVREVRSDAGCSPKVAARLRS